MALALVADLTANALHQTTKQKLRSTSYEGRHYGPSMETTLSFLSSAYLWYSTCSIYSSFYSRVAIYRNVCLKVVFLWIYSMLCSVACRGLVMPGATAWLDAPLPNSSIEQWRTIVIVTGYRLFVTSQFDVIFKFETNILAKSVDITCTFRDAGAAGGQGEQ